MNFSSFFVGSLCKINQWTEIYDLLNPSTVLYFKTKCSTGKTLAFLFLMGTQKAINRAYLMPHHHHISSGGSVTYPLVSRWQSLSLASWHLLSCSPGPLSGLHSPGPQPWWAWMLNLDVLAIFPWKFLPVGSVFLGPLFLQLILQSHSYFQTFCVAIGSPPFPKF